MPNKDGVFVGFWRDHDVDGVLASKLTLSTRNARILLASLAIIVTITTGRSWKLWSLLLRKKKDWRARMEDTDIGTFGKNIPVRRYFTKTRTTSESRPTISAISIIVLVVLAFMHWALFLVAGVFTADISQGNTVVGDGGKKCGFWMADIPATDPAAEDLLPKGLHTALALGANDTYAAESYVRNCYEPENIGDCNRLVTRRLEWTSTHNAACPFTPGTCLEGNNAAFQLDSGNISFAKLGIDSQTKFSFRRRTTCAPITNIPFVYPKDMRTGTPTGSTEQNLAYNMTSANRVAYIYSHFSNLGRNFTYLAFNDSYSGYRLEAFVMPGNPLDAKERNMTAFPHLPLRVENADVTIIYLSMNGILFDKPSYDPWFQANLKFMEGVYVQNERLRVLACTEQKQICRIDTGECGPVQQLVTSDVWHANMNQTISHLDKAALHLVNLVLVDSSIAASIFFRGAVALRASENNKGSIQHTIAREQWKVELSRWFDIGLAKTQLGPLRTVLNPPSIDETNLTNLVPPEAQQWVCRIVKFKIVGYESLSTFGIFFVLVASALINSASLLHNL
jgi:hypothetical protein